MYKEIEKGAEKRALDLTKQRDERCTPAAQALLAVIAKGTVADKTKEELFSDYTPLAREALDIFIEKGVQTSDISYVFRLVLQSVDILKNMIDDSLDKHVESTEVMFWGKPLAEVTIKELDEKLKQKE